MTDPSEWKIPLRWDPACGFVDRGSYEVQVSLRVIKSRLEVVGLSLGGYKGDKVITTSLLRRVRVAEAAQKAAEILAPQMAIWFGPPRNLADMDEQFQSNRAAFVDPILAAYPMVEERARGGPYPSGHLQRVADIYSAARARRQPPTQAVAKALGIKPGAAAKQVYLARKAGHLPPTTPGKAASAGKRPRKTQS